MIILISILIVIGEIFFFSRIFSDKKYIIQWESFTGYGGHGSTRFTLEQAKGICGSQNRRYPQIKHWGKKKIF